MKAVPSLWVNKLVAHKMGKRGSFGFPPLRGQDEEQRKREKIKARQSFLCH